MDVDEAYAKAIKERDETVPSLARLEHPASTRSWFGLGWQARGEADAKKWEELVDAARAEVASRDEAQAELEVSIPPGLHCNFKRDEKLERLRAALASLARQEDKP